MGNVRYLPEPTVRVETGVTQFGEDWPGVFIRGDDAFHYASHLDLFMKNPENTLSAAIVASLLCYLQESRVWPTTEEKEDGKEKL